jgi:hypothetical protein
MDLNVKLQGLKHNLEKVWGCFCKISGVWEFLEFLELFSERKLRGIGPWTSGPGPRRSAHGSMDPLFNVGRSTLDGRTRLECEWVCFPGRRK